MREKRSFTQEFKRRVIGYCVSRELDTQITLTTLNMAICQRQPGSGIIHHSDRDLQYAAGDYIERLKTLGFQISMSRKGNPYDNATAESFIKTLKSEEVYLWEYETLEDVQKKLPYFIEAVYNIIERGCTLPWVTFLPKSLKTS